MKDLRTRRLERTRRPLVPVLAVTILIGLVGCSDSPTPMYPKTPGAVYELKGGAAVPAVVLPGGPRPAVVSPEDLIEPGDTLEMIVRRGAGEEKYAAMVRANGIVTVSFIEVNVKGLSEAEAETRIDQALSTVMRNPRTTVRIVQKVALRPKNFYILGEVKSIGKHLLSRRMTLLQAITQGGGYTDMADLKKVVLISRLDQDRPLVRIANVHAVLQTGDLTADLPLEDNDIIFVPRSQMGDWYVYYTKVLFPVLNTLVSATTAVLLNKTLADLFTGAEPSTPVAVCWVASTLYGEHAWQTHLLRWYILGPFSEHWHGRLFANLYSRYGQWVAQVLQRHPSLQGIVRPLFDRLLRQAVAAAGQERHGEGATRRRGDPPVSASPRLRVPVSS